MEEWGCPASGVPGLCPPRPLRHPQQPPAPRLSRQARNLTVFLLQSRRCPAHLVSIFIVIKSNQTYLLSLIDTDKSGYI